MTEVQETMFVKTVVMFLPKVGPVPSRVKAVAHTTSTGPQAWAKLPDNYSCPPCGAAKFRFKKVPKGSASGKVEVKKSWF